MAKSGRSGRSQRSQASPTPDAKRPYALLPTCGLNGL
jgi:hypothetical protein